MRQIRKKLWILLLVCICLMGHHVLEVQAAASANTSVSGGNVEVGEEFTVTVTISSRQSLGTYNLYVNYDADKLKFSDSNSGDLGGGGGQVKIVGGADTSEEKSASYELRFIANKAGSSNISVSGSAYYFDEDAGEVVDMEVKSSSAKIRAKAPVVASSDNNLSSLVLQTDSASGNSTEVKLTPEFSPEITEYRTTFTYDVNRVVVSATQSDPNATVAVTGTRIDLGDNITKITVTAEDGSTKEYVIRSTKTNALPDPESSSADDPTSSETKPDKAENNIFVEDIQKYIIINLAGVDIPEGFEESTYTYADKTVNVARGISKNLVLMYLADDEELTNAAFYIYDEAGNSFYKMINIQTDKKLYTIIKTPDSLDIPEGFTMKKVKINKTNVDAWVIDGNEEFYLVYAMNWEGKTGLYVYDREEASMQRYIDGVVNGQSTDEKGDNVDQNTQGNEQVESLYQTIEELKSDYKKDRDLKWKMIVGLAIVCALLIILSIILLHKLRDVEIIEEEIPQEEEEGHELKLDMALQANEMSSGVLAANIEDVVKEELGEMPTEDAFEEESQSIEPEEILGEESEQNPEEEATAAEKSEQNSEEEATAAEKSEQNPEKEATVAEKSETAHMKSPQDSGEAATLEIRDLRDVASEVKFVQPAEMKIVEPEIFEQAIISQEESGPKDFSDIESELSVNGLNFHEEDVKTDKKPQTETITTNDEDDFEIEFVDIEDER